VGIPGQGEGGISGRLGDTLGGAMGANRLVHRYYDPATEQFLSVDPAVDITGTPYSYTNADPVNGDDPDGLAPQTPKLSQEEEEAVSNKEKGLPYDKKVYNRAMRKIQQGEKYRGARRSGQSNNSNVSAVGPPCPEIVMAHPYNPKYNPWQSEIPEGNPHPNAPSLLWLPGGQFARDLGLSGGAAAAFAVIVNIAVGSAEAVPAAAG